MNTNLQSHRVVRNSDENKLIQCNYLQYSKKQRNIATTNFSTINTLVTQNN